MSRRLPKDREFWPRGLELTDEDFEALHDRVDRTRSTSSTATVPIVALRRLLADHARALGHLAEIERSMRFIDKSPAARRGDFFVEEQRP